MAGDFVIRSRTIRLQDNCQPARTDREFMKN